MIYIPQKRKSGFTNSCILGSLELRNFLLLSSICSSKLNVLTIVRKSFPTGRPICFGGAEKSKQKLFTRTARDWTSGRAAKMLQGMVRAANMIKGVFGGEEAAVLEFEVTTF